MQGPLVCLSRILSLVAYYVTQETECTEAPGSKATGEPGGSGMKSGQPSGRPMERPRYAEGARFGRMPPRFSGDPR